MPATASGASTNSWLIAALGFLVTCVIYVLSSLSIACYVPELFPTELRLRGSGIANAAGRAVNILVPYAVVASYDSFGLHGVFALIAVTLLVQVVVLLTWGSRPSSTRWRISPAKRPPMPRFEHRSPRAGWCVRPIANGAGLPHSALR